jgi:uncharacterized protein
VKIDVFCHISPKRYVDRIIELDTPGSANLKTRTLALPVLWDMDARFRMMDEFGQDYVQVPSLAAPPIEAFPDHAGELARLANEEMAALVSRHPDRFLGFVASLPMTDAEAALAEIEHAIGELGAVGVQMFTNVNGAPLDDPRFAPLFARATELDAPIWLHPTRTSAWPDYPTEDRSKYEIWWLFGWPHDTAVCMARLVFSGVLERHPSLKLIAHHGGSMVPYFAGRVGPGMDQLGARTPPRETDLLGDASSLPRRPIDYFRQFYVDTALFGARESLECSLAFFGVDRMLFASDSPFDPEHGAGYIRATIDNVDSLEISAEAREKIYEGNARRLLSRLSEKHGTSELSSGRPAKNPASAGLSGRAAEGARTLDLLHGKQTL